MAIDGFFLQDVSKIILDRCSIKQFHKLEGRNDGIANIFRLNYVRDRVILAAI